MKIPTVEDRAGHGSQVRSAHVSVSHLPEKMLEAGSALEQEVALFASSLQQWLSSYGGNCQYTDDPLPNNLTKSISLNKKHIHNIESSLNFYTIRGISHLFYLIPQDSQSSEILSVLNSQKTA